MVWREANGWLLQPGVHSRGSRRAGVVCVVARAVAEAEERRGSGGGYRCWQRLRVSSYPPSLGSLVHACNVSCAHRTISLDSAAATRRAPAAARHGPPHSTMQASGYAARTHHTVHALAMAGAPGPSRSPPCDAQCARDRLGRVPVGLVVSCGLCWGPSVVPAAVPSSPTPALDTPEGSTWAQTTAAWCRAGL
jgi:hypothetical protein